jgi:uncharacterized alpha-E superfamily protein
MKKQKTKKLSPRTIAKQNAELTEQIEALRNHFHRREEAYEENLNAAASRERAVIEVLHDRKLAAGAIAQGMMVEIEELRSRIGRLQLRIKGLGF